MDISGVGSTSATHTTSGASGGAPPRQKMSNLFDSIDTSSTGSITKAQFDQAFQTKNPPVIFQNQGADAIFAALDPSGAGSVSKSDFVSTMSKLMASLRADSTSQLGSLSSDTLAASLQSLNAMNPSSISADAPPGSLLNISA